MRLPAEQEGEEALEKGLIPILCCGETLGREKWVLPWTGSVCRSKSDLADVTADQVKGHGCIRAYLGNRYRQDCYHRAAEEVCKGIRECIAEMYDTDTAEAVRIQYGGSVNAGNAAAELFAQPDIDGGLVGGASLKADFGKIVNYK